MRIWYQDTRRDSGNRRLWRPDLQLVEVNGARRGALPGGDARHMLLQDSLLGALAVQVIWGLYRVASRTLRTLDQRWVCVCGTVDRLTPRARRLSGQASTCSTVRQYTSVRG